MEEERKTGKYHRIMVIDDNYIDRYIAERNLIKFNLADLVQLFESGSDALEYLMVHSGEASELPQMIFLDIRMPGMDGFEFLEQYARLPSLVHDTCSIIMLSSSIDTLDLNRIKENPFVRKFMNKPLEKRKLEDL